MVEDSNEMSTLKDGTYKSWIIHASSEEEITDLQKKVDYIFSEYSFYPEIDWIEYGYRPPEGYQVLGAWRHPQTLAFAFLLDNPRIKTIPPSTQLLLYVAGALEEISQLESKVSKLKIKLDSVVQKTKTDVRIGDRIERARKSKSLATLSAVLVILTGVINAFSLYLRKLPSPQFESQKLVDIYNILVAGVHYLALFLLIIVIGICVIFLIKYGILLIRRL